MPISIEYKFEELNLILDPNRPTRAIGWFNGAAEIIADRSGYAVGDIYLPNATSSVGALDKFIAISPAHQWHPLFEASLRAQFNRAIEDTITAYLETA